MRTNKVQADDLQTQALFKSKVSAQRAKRSKSNDSIKKGKGMQLNSTINNIKKQATGPLANQKQDPVKDAGDKEISSDDSEQSSSIMEDLYVEMEDKEAMTNYYKSLSSE